MDASEDASRWATTPDLPMPVVKTTASRAWQSTIDVANASNAC